MNIAEAPRFVESEASNEFRLGFIFDTHYTSADDVQTKSAMLAAKFREVFCPGEQNILLDEFPEISYLSDRYASNFLYTLEKENGQDRHLRAFTFGSCGKEFPQDAPPQEITAYAVSLISSEDEEDQHNLQYSLAVASACDQLETEGYRIDIVFEKGVRSEDYPIIERIIDDEKVESRESTELLAEYAYDRNTNIIQQLKDICEQSKKEKLNSNVIVLLGTMHSEMVTRLPDDLRDKMKYAESGDADIHEFNGDDPWQLQWFAIMTKLLYEEEVSQEEWDYLSMLEYHEESKQEN